MADSQITALIVGAGPTGLVMAHELARHGVRCRIIDKLAESSKYSKALGIQARTLETFYLMGIADPFLAQGHRVGGVKATVDGREAVHVRFDGLDTPYPFVLILPQSQTEQILIEALQHHGVTVERSTELTTLSQDDGGVTAQLQTSDGKSETVRADWLLACDGAHSTARHALKLDFAGAAYPDHFLLADVKIDGMPGDDELHVFADTHGPVALFPLPGGRWRIVADDPPADFPDQPTLQQCQALIDARQLGHLKLSDPVWTTLFRIHHRAAPHNRVGRVFLAGDAVHIHSPAGGQGMNTGIQDAFNLAWKLTLVSSGAADASLLDSYEAERLPVDQAVVRKTDRMTRAMSLKNPIARWARDVMLPLATHLPGAMESFRRSIAQIDYGYRHSAIVEEHAIAGGGPAAGDRAPDAMLSHPGHTGEAPRLFDLLASGQHTLLLLTDVGNADTTLIDAIAPWARHISICSIAAKSGSGEWSEVDGSVTRQYGSQPAAYLIRPDGYVGFRCSLPLAEKLLPAYLRRLLSSAVESSSK